MTNRSETPRTDAFIVPDAAEMREPMVTFVCEVPHLVLRIDQPYIFKVDPTCEKCSALGKAAADAYGCQLPEKEG